MKPARQIKPIEVRLIQVHHRMLPEAHKGRLLHDLVSLLAPPGVDTWFDPMLHFFGESNFDGHSLFARKLLLIVVIPFTSSDMLRQLVVLGIQGSEISIQRGNGPEMRKIDSGKMSVGKGCITYIVINVKCDVSISDHHMCTLICFQWRPHGTV